MMLKVARAAAYVVAYDEGYNYPPNGSAVKNCVLMMFP